MEYLKTAEQVKSYIAHLEKFVPQNVRIDISIKQLPDEEVKKLAITSQSKFWKPSIDSPYFWTVMETEKVSAIIRGSHKEVTIKY